MFVATWFLVRVTVRVGQTLWQADEDRIEFSPQNLFDFHRIQSL
jgi:hypothetical protein